MTAPAPVVVDLLERAIARAKPRLLTGTTKERVHLLWAAVKLARNLGTSDVVFDAFMALAIEVRLIDERGYWLGDDVRADLRRGGAQDIAHVIAWGLRGVNPFETGPRQ